MIDHLELGEVQRLLIDATHVRAHRYAAGLAEKRGAGLEQGLARSCGGFFSKIVSTAADANTAIAVDVVPSKTHEAS